MRGKSVFMLPSSLSIPSRFGLTGLDGENLPNDYALPDEAAFADGLEFPSHSPFSTGLPSLKKQRCGAQAPPKNAHVYLDRYHRLRSNIPESSPAHLSLITSPHLLKHEAYQPSFPTTRSSNPTPAGTCDSVFAQGNLSEDSLTLRRREANRLAAQRFRSRKKGQQDSLEERVRQLEDERDALLRQLGGACRPSSRDTLGIGIGDDNDFRPGSKHVLATTLSPTPQIATPYFPLCSNSPERREPSLDIDVRIAALESANRKLQDVLRSFVEENVRLRADIESWRGWQRELPESQACRGVSEQLVSITVMRPECNFHVRFRRTA